MREATDDLLQQGFRYAYSLCCQKHDAEDLVHDAWVKISKANKDINKGLLFVSIRNLFIDKCRHNNLIHIDVDLQVNDLPEYELEFESPISDSVLERALGLLRTSEREMLFLHTIEGYTAAEIAELTKSSRGTVLSSLFRSKKKLKKLLGMHFYEATDTFVRGEL